MWKKITISLSVFVFSIFVLITSILRSAAVKYEFNNQSSKNQEILGEDSLIINYYLPFPGNVLPDSPLWPIKAGRDKVWLLLTTNPTKRSELKLLFADKRIGSVQILFEKGKVDTGLATLTKAEKYLEEASHEEEQNRYKGLDTIEFLERIANASLKHYEIVEKVENLAPEEAKPIIIQSKIYSRKTFERARNALLEKGLTPPENPFQW